MRQNLNTMTIRLFLNIITLALVGSLFSCQQNAPAETTATEANAGSGNIVFIRLDSLTSQYKALSEKNDVLQTRVLDAEKRQGERIATLQRDMQSFQRRANSGRMAPKDIGAEQEVLAGREQALMQENERIRQELQIEQLKLSAEFEENLLNVLEEIQAEKNYDYILSYGAGTGVLMVNDANDITPEVVSRLNKIPMDGELESNAVDSTDVAPTQE